MANGSRFLPKGITTPEDNEASYLSEHEVRIDNSLNSEKH